MQYIAEHPPAGSIVRFAQNPSQHLLCVARAIAQCSQSVWLEDAVIVWGSWAPDVASPMLHRRREGEATRFGDIASLLISGYEPTIPSVYMCVCISALNLYPLYSAMMASTRSKMSSSMEVLTKRILHSSEVTHRSNTVHPGSRLPRFRIFATSLQASKIVKRCTPLIDFDFQCRHIAI